LRTCRADLDPFDPTTGQRILRGAGRFCIVLAVGAVALGMSDLMHIRSIAGVREFIQQSRQRVAELIAGGLLSAAMAAPSPYAIVVIPRNEIAAALPLPQTPSAAIEAPVSREVLPVAEHAVARDFNAAETGMTLPQPAPALLTARSPAQLLHLSAAARAKAEWCLAAAIYFEARGESERGQQAVAQVVMNRVFSGFYPRDVCGVVYQNANRRRACQFSFACNGKRRQIKERDAWAQAERTAQAMLAGRLYVPEVAASTHFHAVYVHPDWVTEMRKIAHVGIHDFYRPIAWGDGAGEPAWHAPVLAQAEQQ
jgi:spore germination cell wall hydrolase CwlJ-like protein